MIFFVPRGAIGRVLLLVALSCAAACGDDDDGPQPTFEPDGGRPTARDAAADSAAVTPDAATGGDACAQLDAVVSECRVARTIMSCELPRGVRAFCSSDGEPCEGADADACRRECKPDEYGVVCGGIGPNAPVQEPPRGCFMMPPNPGGTSFHCCPCGGAASPPR